MHLEAVTEPVRQRIMPGKAEVPVSVYLRSFERAVSVFGRGQVSTYILGGLGDAAEDILAVCRVLAGIGVYPFVVPFVPIRGTPLESHAPPDPAFMHALLSGVAAIVRDAGLTRETIRAGCGRCGACSTLARARGCGMIVETVSPFRSRRRRPSSSRPTPGSCERTFACAVASSATSSASSSATIATRSTSGPLPIVAVAWIAGMPDDVVGVVRIWRREPGEWWGGRLGTHPDHRGDRTIAPGLVRLAVGTACRQGCSRFLATVQTRNVTLFERLHWRALAEVRVCGTPHALMEADLAHYGGGRA